MRAILGLGISGYLVRLVIFVVIAAIAVGMAGCGQTVTPVEYTLIIVSTEGGTVTDPGEGTSTHSNGALVILVAEAEDGYHFVIWSGDVETVADVNAATTNIAMNGNKSITANFARGEPIWDWYDLDAIRDNLYGHYVLMNHLDSTTAGYEELAGPIADDGKGWQPIGTCSLNPSTSFFGSLDGQGYDISDLFINRTGENWIGLFGNVAEGGVIHDVRVVNATVDGATYVGGLTGGNKGTMSHSHFSGALTGKGSVGGIVGRNSGIIVDSHFTGHITCSGTYVGGIVGENPGGTVHNSHYRYNQVEINGEFIITIGALFEEDFDEWLSSDRLLDVNDKLSEEDGYYLIDNVAAFKQLLAFGQDASLKFKLTDDVDLSTECDFYVPYLAGVFDGNGHKIYNMNFNYGFVSHVGLFGYLASSGEVVGIGVEDQHISGSTQVGGVVGRNWGGAVRHSYSAGTVTGDSYVGGLIGENWCGTVGDCHTTASVTGTSDVGGLVGNNVGIVSRSYAAGSVEGHWNVGGLLGWNGGTVESSHFGGTVIGNYYVGGLAGFNEHGVLSHSYSTGSVSGYECVGGLVGVTYSHSSDVIAVSDCYATGNVTGQDYVGGLAGCNWGGIVSDSFWDTEASGQTTSDGGTGKTTAEMMSFATFTDTAADGLDEPWDIIAVAPGETDDAYAWNIVDGETYPFLSWESVS